MLPPVCFDSFVSIRSFHPFRQASEMGQTEPRFTSVSNSIPPDCKGGYADGCCCTHKEHRFSIQPIPHFTRNVVLELIGRI